MFSWNIFYRRYDDANKDPKIKRGRQIHLNRRRETFLLFSRKKYPDKKIKHTGKEGMGPWAFGVPLILVSTLGLLLNGYVLLVVLGLGKQVNINEQISIKCSRLPAKFHHPSFFPISIFREFLSKSCSCGVWFSGINFRSEISLSLSLITVMPQKSPQTCDFNDFCNRSCQKQK